MPYTASMHAKLLEKLDLAKRPFTDQSGQSRKSGFRPVL